MFVSVCLLSVEITRFAVLEAYTRPMYYLQSVSRGV